MHVKYTAREGGSTLRGLAEATLKDRMTEIKQQLGQTGLHVAINMKQDCPRFAASFCPLMLSKSDPRFQPAPSYVISNNPSGVYSPDITLLIRRTLWAFSCGWSFTLRLMGLIRQAIRAMYSSSESPGTVLLK